MEPKVESEMLDLQGGAKPQKKRAAPKKKKSAAHKKKSAAPKKKSAAPKKKSAAPKKKSAASKKRSPGPPVHDPKSNMIELTKSLADKYIDEKLRKTIYIKDIFLRKWASHKIDFGKSLKPKSFGNRYETYRLVKSNPRARSVVVGTVKNGVIYECTFGCEKIYV